MKGLILDEGERYYSTFGKIFKEIKDVSEKYNWLITATECYPENAEHQKILDKPYVWLSGEELKRMLNEEDFQWIWGVMSGFDKSIELADVLQYSLPYANEYPDFWKNPLTLQHNLSEIEMVAFDSSLTLFISKNDEIIKAIARLYPLAKDLEKYNNE